MVAHKYQQVDKACPQQDPHTLPYPFPSSAVLQAGPLLSPQQLAAFCPETLVVAHKYQQDFENFGIHLRDEQQRAKVVQLLALNQHFPAQFNATLVSWGMV